MTKLLSLPLENICNILYNLSPYEASLFARTCKLSSRIFKFDINRIIDQVITEWSVLIFKCPRCGKAIRGGGEVTSTIFIAQEPGILKEQLYRTCRQCYYHLRIETMKQLNGLLVAYRKDRDHETKYRHIAFEGMCRYQSSGKYPRKKDLKFVEGIVHQLYKVSL